MCFSPALAPIGRHLVAIVPLLAEGALYFYTSVSFSRVVAVAVDMD